MMRIMTPSGVLRNVTRVLPICEIRLEFNGRSRRAVEISESMECEPTALGFEFQSKGDCDSCVYGNELFIGNLKPEAVREILRKLLSDGSYDFSDMEYQKAGWIMETTFDKGATIPYSSAYTCGICSLSDIKSRMVCDLPFIDLESMDQADGWNEGFKEGDDEQE
ncbi:MAG: hypothetical protein NC548_25200 [Lachnospiraceae bacterium]|nr:hypothetical protein [Lachnospiraceae bacterium]